MLEKNAVSFKRPLSTWAAGEQGVGQGVWGETLAVCVCCSVYARLRGIRRYKEEAMGKEWRTQGMMLEARGQQTQKMGVRLEDLSS